MIVRTSFRKSCLILGALALTLTTACTSADRSNVIEPGSRAHRYSRSSTRPAPAASTNKATPDLSEERFLANVSLLAHDELGGRGTGSKGIALAAGYIAGQFAAAGLEPGGPDGTYFQEFTVNQGAELLDETALTIEGCDVDLALKDDFTPFGFSTSGDFAGDIVFVGYGVTAKAANYDDYAGIDVDGKIALMLRREPSDLDSDDDVNHANFDTKVKLAAKHGAVAVIIVNQDPGEDGIDGLMRFRSRGGDFDLPSLHMKRKAADKLLAAGGLQPLATLQQKLDNKNGNVSAPLAGVSATGTVAIKTKKLLARNVIGLLPATNPRATQYVVIGGHYDHLGTRRGTVYNGADDNGSGTAGVMELAWAMSEMPHRERHVIFMTFSGEEIGLLGSKHYAAHPTVDIDSIAAMINMDMIGRLSDEEANMLAIQGLGTGDSFKEIVERRTDEFGMKYIPDDSARGPSDHDSFYRKGVPSLFFFTGIHEDYHQPGDDTDKVNVSGAIEIIRLIYAIATDLVNAPDNPQFVEVNERANIFRGARPSASGVVMGFMPDMEDESDAPGWRIAMVTPGGGAEKAGMKEGDRIISINGQTINGFSDYRSATKGKKPGDILDVVITRGGTEQTLKVELAARGQGRRSRPRIPRSNT